MVKVTNAKLLPITDWFLVGKSWIADPNKYWMVSKNGLSIITCYNRFQFPFTEVIVTYISVGMRDLDEIPYINKY